MDLTTVIERANEKLLMDLARLYREAERHRERINFLEEQLTKTEKMFYKLENQKK
jgi:predicted ATP-grasp superfamily ATP-dependent carboligase